MEVLMLQPIINTSVHISACVWRRPVWTCAAGMDCSGLACECVSVYCCLLADGVPRPALLSDHVNLMDGLGKTGVELTPLSLLSSGTSWRLRECVCEREFMCVMSRRLTDTLWHPKQPDSARWHHHWGSVQPPPSLSHARAHTHTHTNTHTYILFVSLKKKNTFRFSSHFLIQMNLQHH